MFDAATVRRVRERWHTPDGQRLAAAVTERLVAGGRLGDLDLERVDGRWDLRGFSVPPPIVTGEAVVGPFLVQTQASPTDWRGLTLEHVDLSGATLDGIGMFQCTFRDVLLDRASLRGARTWAMTMEDVSLTSADLRGSGLTAWIGGQGGRYLRVTFARGDLRGANTRDGTFIDCDFAEARLDKVEFWGATFERCRFAGVLRDVVFSDLSHHGSPKSDVNRMLDVDFSEATLVTVAFHGLDLDRCLLPRSPEHVIIHHYRCALRCVGRMLERESPPRSGRLAVAVNYSIEWAGPNQEIGVFHRDQLGRSPIEIEQAIEMLRAAEAECAREA